MFKNHYSVIFLVIEVIKTPVILITDDETNGSI